MVAKGSTPIWIYMNGEKVARLSRTGGGRLELAYQEGWLSSPNRRPLSLSLPGNAHPSEYCLSDLPCRPLGDLRPDLVYHVIERI